MASTYSIDYMGELSSVYKWIPSIDVGIDLAGPIQLWLDHFSSLGG